jgi:GT2 family glycosyltransferase
MDGLDASEHSALLTRVFTDMASFAWESSFFDLKAAYVVHQVDTQISILPPSLKAFAVSCAMARPQDRDAAEKFEVFFEDGDMQAVRKLLDGRQKEEPGNLYWMRFARYLGLLFNELDWYEPYLGSAKLPPAVLMAMKAEIAFAREDWSEAENLFAVAYAQAPLTDFLVKQGECLNLRGERDAAANCWNMALRKRPWQVNLALRLSDIVLDRDIPKGPPPGLGRVLLYTWNHARGLDAALAALAESNLGSCGITLLNNGSTDDTAEVLAAWQDRFGEQLETLALPTNVGAPAARNWLLELENIRRADWVIFLDDDALVPPGWLGLFGTAMAAYPQADIFGCRVVEQAAPLTLQSVDLHFDAGGKEMDRDRAGRHLSGGNVLVPHALEAADFGQFSYLRPAMSVTGCCHLLTRKSIDNVGLFDLRFSPSQFDDFERDLRSALAGYLCVYQGHLAVRHIKRSGARAGISDWQRANVGGNMFKLWNTYSADDVEELIETDDRILWQDLCDRLEDLKNVKV